MDGFINLLKPAGMTSHDAVSALRRILRMKKIGHTGTLDPMAAGVLVMCVGAGTKAAEYLEADSKSYRCELLLGVETDTGDIWGSIINENRNAAALVTENQVRNVLSSMKGIQQQYPPMYSAVRKNGRHLYEYARKGETVEVEPRTININDIRPVHIFHEPGRVIFDVDCSKGTYIRTVCTDIGKKLSCGAAMSCLVRTRSGKFFAEDSVTIEQLCARVSDAEGINIDDVLARRNDNPLTADMSDFIMPADSMLEGFGSIILNENESRKYVNGGKIALRNCEDVKRNSRQKGSKYENVYLVYDTENRFFGTALFDKNGKIFTVGKVFFR